MDWHQSWDRFSRWPLEWHHSSCMSFWPIFHGPVIFFLQIIWWIDLELIQRTTLNDTKVFVFHYDRCFWSSDFAWNLHWRISANFGMKSSPWPAIAPGPVFCRLVILRYVVDVVHCWSELIETCDSVIKYNIVTNMNLLSLCLLLLLLH